MLTTILYSNRWTAIISRLNKKNGSYYKVGEKKVSITSAQQSIIENNLKISDIQSLLDNGYLSETTDWSVQPVVAPTEQTNNYTCATHYESILTRTLSILRPNPETLNCGEK